MKNCSVCGKDLPNRYAVAGECEEAACESLFCSLHWSRSNRRCPEHGYEEQVCSKGEPMTKDIDNTEDNKAKEANIKKAMKEAVKIAKKLGSGAAELLKKLKKDKSPEAMIKTLDEQDAINKNRREEVSGRVERLYNDIASKKKEYQSAPKARQRILESELKSLLASYKTVERELNILLENERNLSLIKGRLNEIVAYGMSGVTEIMIDDVIDDIEDKVSDAESIADAARDLEKAGKRKDRDSDDEDLWAQLGEFGDDEIPVTVTEALKDSDVEDSPVGDLDEDLDLKAETEKDI